MREIIHRVMISTLVFDIKENAKFYESSDIVHFIPCYISSPSTVRKKLISKLGLGIYKVPCKFMQSFFKMLMKQWEEP